MRKYIIAAAAGLPLIVLLIIGAAYLHDEVIGAERVSRGVTVVGVDVSRATPQEAAAVVRAHEADLLAAPVEVTVDDTTYEIDPVDVGLAIDEDAVVQLAMNARRRDGFWANLWSWAGSWVSDTSIEVPVTIDDAKLADILDGYTEAIGKPAYDGTIKIVNGEVVPDYPKDGVRVDVDAAIPLVREQLLKVDREPIDLPLAPISPRIDASQLDEAVAKAKALTDRPVFLTNPDTGKVIVFTTGGLRTALRHTIVASADPKIEVSLDPAELERIVKRSSDGLTVPAVPASYTFDKDTKIFHVVPSIPSVVVDLDAIPDAVMQAIEGDGKGEIPMTEGPDAEFDTQAARAGMPLREVSSFTTYHPAGQPRVTNIQLLADEIDGSVVLPGEVFSINETAGERTLEEGYVRAGAIIDGEVTCCDSPVNIGGGTSQFATTFYNAVFFGCYEDVFHQPHSLYFSRYPYVREATLGYPAPDVKFRNDSDTAVYISTSHTPSSITVTFYGDNGGRECTSSTSGNTVTRTMTHPDGTITKEHWTWHYKEKKKKKKTE